MRGDEAAPLQRRQEGWELHRREEEEEKEGVAGAGDEDGEEAEEDDGGLAGGVEDVEHRHHQHDGERDRAQHVRDLAQTAGDGDDPHEQKSDLC